MWVVAGSTGQKHTRAIPTADPLAVRPSLPVTRLGKVALATEDVGLIKTKGEIFDGVQSPGALQVMTGKTPKSRFTVEAVLQSEIVMRCAEFARGFIRGRPGVAGATGMECRVASAWYNGKWRFVGEKRLAGKLRTGQIRRWGWHRAGRIGVAGGWATRWWRRGGGSGCFGDLVPIPSGDGRGRTRGGLPGRRGFRRQGYGDNPNTDQIFPHDFI